MDLSRQVFNCSMRTAQLSLERPAVRLRLCQLLLSLRQRVLRRSESRGEVRLLASNPRRRPCRCPSRWSARGGRVWSIGW